MTLRDLFRKVAGWRPSEPDYLRMDIEDRLRRLDFMIELQERDQRHSDGGLAPQELEEQHQ